VTVLAYLAGVLVIVVGVALSIALHEIGHLAPAKRFGVKVTQYMVGFGPTVWSRTRGETEYGVKAIPLGGYIRMVGMFPPGKDGHVRADTTGRWSLMVEQAREQSRVEIGDVPRERLFYTRPVRQRLVIMLGGPTMNLIIAAVLLAGLQVFYGTPQQTTTLSTVSECVLPVRSKATACAPSDPKAPANLAGLKSGDTVVAFDGQPIGSWAQMQAAIRANRGEATTITVERAGRQITSEITPVVADRPVVGKDGQAVKDADGEVRTRPVGFLGISPDSEMVPQSITTVPGVLGDYLARTAGVVLRIPEKMVGVAKAAFGGGERDPNGPISVVGVGRFAGEVASAESTDDATITVVDRFATLISLVMSLNLALFVFNLIPLLPLDGGHVAGALWEGLRRQVARLRRRPDPGPVDVARGLPIAYGVATLLIGMSVLLIYADLVRPIRLNG
jgi:membrane-associated protease RseP (regulator of RpoE activity)